MQSLEYDHDKKIINAARKFKKCFNFTQYEQPQEVNRREELLEDYKKYSFVMRTPMILSPDYISLIFLRKYA